MIVRDIMQTKLVTVESDDTLSHAAGLLRQYRFHHLPIVHSIQTSHAPQEPYTYQPPMLIFKGLLTSQDIDMAVALAQQEEASNPLAHSWQGRRVAEIMQSSSISLTPRTSVAVAAQLLVERGIHCLPVLEPGQADASARDILVGLVTRSDILLTFARSLGALEPGTQVTIQLPNGCMAPLAKALLAADTLHIGVCSVLVGPQEQHASLRLRTINPAPLFMHLEQDGVEYASGDVFMGDNDYV